MGQHDQPSTNRPPEFADEAEAAAFWDDHSALEFPEEFEEVEARFGRPLIRRVLIIELGQDDREELARLATERGTDPTELARRWVRERIGAESRQRSTPEPA